MQLATSPAPSDAVFQLSWLLLGATLLGILARWTRIPYPVALVIGGLLVEASHLVTVPSLDPNLVLLVLLPPLLFDASFRFDVSVLPSLSHPILLLAVPGTLITAAVVAGVLVFALAVPLPVALLFGSLVAATDPVAVMGVFQRLGVSHRLAAIAEGESLVNDGVAITLYIVSLGLALGGSTGTASSLLLFVREVGGGVLVGAVLGVAGSRLTRLVDDHLVEMMLSTVLAYGSYQFAQYLQGSGALACVTAGLIHGSYGRRVGMSENTRRLLDDLWEYLGFAANGVVFLLVGFSVQLQDLALQAFPIFVAVASVLVARALVMIGLGLVDRRHEVAATRGERAVLWWGGLRGALTIALALALPESTPDRRTLVAMAFGVVLFTLVGQGLTLPLAIKRLKLSSPLPPPDGMSA